MPEFVERYPLVSITNVTTFDLVSTSFGAGLSKNGVRRLGRPQCHKKQKALYVVSHSSPKRGSAGPSSR